MPKAKPRIISRPHCLRPILTICLLDSFRYLSHRRLSFFSKRFMNAGFYQKTCIFVQH